MAAPAGNNQVPGASGRPIKLDTKYVDNVVVAEGHGEWRANPVGGGRVRFYVPAGIEIVIYQGVGVGLDDPHGVSIGQLQDVPARLPTQYDAGNAEYDTDTGGHVRENTPGVRIYRSGTLCPDLTLLAYNEPGYPVITPPQPTSFSVPVGHPITLKAICDRYNGQSVQIRWGACTVER